MTEMDKRTKTVVFLVGAIIIGAIVIAIVMKFWGYTIAGVAGFILGYVFALNRKRLKNKKK